MKKAKLQWRVSAKEAGMRLLPFLKEHYVEAPSVKALKRAIDHKSCTINQRIETFSSYILKENDLVALNPAIFEEERQEKDWKVPILYEDKGLLIINKPSGLLSDKRALNACFPQFKGNLELAHRLDKETSGVLLLSKNAKMQKRILLLFKERDIRKVYLAIVDGVVEKNEGLIDNFLGKIHSYQGQTIYGAVDEKKGQRAVTFWKCVKRGKAASLLACELHTGRTHQLRVHLNGMAHPILGDVQYGKRFRCPFTPKRNLLHAYSVTFTHPQTGAKLKIIAPIPTDFKEALNALNLHSVFK